MTTIPSTQIGQIQEAIIKITHRRRLHALDFTILNFIEIGRFVIIELSWNKGPRVIKGVGIGRRGQGEPKNKPEVGINLAVSRAIGAIKLKSENKLIIDPLMG